MAHKDYFYGSFEPDLVVFDDPIIITPKQSPPGDPLKHLAEAEKNVGIPNASEDAKLAAAWKEHEKLIKEAFDANMKQMEATAKKQAEMEKKALDYIAQYTQRREVDDTVAILSAALAAYMMKNGDFEVTMTCEEIAKIRDTFRFCIDFDSFRESVVVRFV